jgi:hypothetical protein
VPSSKSANRAGKASSRSTALQARISMGSLPGQAKLRCTGIDTKGHPHEARPTVPAVLRITRRFPSRSRTDWSSTRRPKPLPLGSSLTRGAVQKTHAPPRGRSVVSDQEAERAGEPLSSPRQPERLAAGRECLVRGRELPASHDRVRAAVPVGAATDDGSAHRRDAAGVPTRMRAVREQEDDARCPHERYQCEQSEEPPVAPGDSSLEALRLGRHTVTLRRARRSPGRA